MKNSEVEAILKFYKWIDLDIKVAGEWLEQYEAGYNPLGAAPYDGMPHGNKLGDSTALLAMKLAETDTRERVEALKERTSELKKLRTQIFKEISSLSALHKVIICGLYLQGKKWGQIGEEIGYSVRHLKFLKDCPPLPGFLWYDSNVKRNGRAAGLLIKSRCLFALYF